MNREYVTLEMIYAQKCRHCEPISPLRTTDPLTNPTSPLTPTIHASPTDIPGLVDLAWFKNSLFWVTKQAKASHLKEIACQH